MLKKNKNILIYLSIGIVLIVSMFFVFNKKDNEYKELPKVKLKEQTNLKQFALMLEQTSGKGDYQESSDELPTIGYHFNKEKSGCTDINGKVINDVLDYDYENYVVLLDTSKTSYCYLYYDKLTLGETIRKINSKGLNSDLEGGLYRYQGVKNEVDNYVCLNEECDSSNRYRIIGINEDNEVKLIKEESLGTITYGNDIDIDTSWPDSNIYKALNTDNNSFYNTLTNDIKDMIIEKDWYNARMYWSFFEQTSKDIEKMYKIETGQEKTTYYENVPVSEEGKEGVICNIVTKDLGHLNEKMCYVTKNEYAKSKKFNIGLMYIHDYYYSIQKGGYDCNYNSKNEAICMTSWILNNANEEWLLSTRGYANDYGIYSQYAITLKSVVSDKHYKSSLNYRPVFYISKDLSVIKGNGTVDEPFIIKK